jgi:hypothetical protein
MLFLYWLVLISKKLQIRRQCEACNLYPAIINVHRIGIWVRINPHHQKKENSRPSHTGVIILVINSGGGGSSSRSSNDNNNNRLVSITNLMHKSFILLTICMLHYNPPHVSSINMPIFRKTNCIITAVQYAGWELCSHPAYCTAVCRAWQYQMPW